ncbi:hybrid sensor histidine kinase/response regulator [bacterium]|nr:hybrid sensor histidine kinase/response regulator [bacterium]
MINANQGEPADLSLLDLFRTELETGAKRLEVGLVDLERDQSPEKTEPLMRAAHSIKGAARIVGLDLAVSLAHAMEDMLSAAQHGTLHLTSDHIDVLLKCNDIFLRLSSSPVAGMSAQLSGEEQTIQNLSVKLRTMLSPEPQAQKQTEPKPEQPAVEPEAAPKQSREFSDESMLQLFRVEVETHSRILESGLVELEKNQTPEKIEPLMRAAHSIKGAARIVNLNLEVSLAHAMEDVLSAAQHGNLILHSEHIDLLLRSNDIFSRMSSLTPSEIHSSLSTQSDRVKSLTRSLIDVLTGKPFESSLLEARQLVSALPKKEAAPREETFVRVLADTLNRILGLTGECLIQAKLAKPFSASLLTLKHLYMEVASSFETLLVTVKNTAGLEEVYEKNYETFRLLEQSREILYQHMEEYEIFSRRIENLTDQLYSEVISSRMTPFSDGLLGFPRMVRDLSRRLGKKVNLVIQGGSTPVDRDILEKLESPLTHILRNAVDHGIETPDVRAAAGKKPEGTLRIEARHMFGMLNIIIQDDGMGIDPEKLRKKVVRDGHVSDEMAKNLTRDELFEFLFLPGFTTHEKVTEVSGRGIGLDVVLSMLHSVSGSIRIESEPGRGTTFHLHLPITLSVVRALLMDIAGETYALPLTRIEHVIDFSAKELKTVEDRPICIFEGENIGIVNARQILRLPQGDNTPDSLPIAIISDRLNRYGFVVDRFLGQAELVVRPLDARLGKIPTISSGAILEDGSPVLIMDADDLVRSIDEFVTHGKPEKIGNGKVNQSVKKKILVVDDSITVREAERKMLQSRGYEVSAAVDGMDAWNTLLKREAFDLVITDIDMPRMNGLELIGRIKNNPDFSRIPIIIISYKDREEDRMKGLDAGADYYLTKASFHDDRLFDAVNDLLARSIQ